ncbi:hypothetical protein [Bordetella genomosp. 11]|uniref:3-isopropylmalate dehydratase n=1 Tax=Bordetella genomosp. 11 TaxID=1416808 RepID=A0A261UEU1_9BORD|nr:hypothetical protein [Bordetella genomosp. 11]OZI60111.1 hypothetical protein CAL28_11630 [Bordetella genomosp. 11]
MKALCIGIALSCVLTGCATNLVSRDKAKVIPADRLYEPTFVYRGGQEKAEISVIRDSGFVGSGCLHRLWVDNVKVAALDPGEAIDLGLSPGPHFMRIEMGVGLCANIQISESFELKSGERRVYRVMTDSNFKLGFVRME